MSKRPPDDSELNSLSKTRVCSWVELQAASKLCWTGLLKCDNCNSIPHGFKRDRKFDWALTLICDNCNTSIKICTICPSNRTQFKTEKDIKRHIRLKSHKNNVKNQCILDLKREHYLNHGEKGISFINTNQGISNEESFKFLKEKGLEYFIHQERDQGNAYLLASTYFPENDAIEKVTSSDADFNILLGHFVYNLSSSMRTSFMEIVRGLKPYMLSSTENKPHPYAMRIPFVPSTLRSTYLEGKDSFFQNLPIPPISSYLSGEGESENHSYCSLLDCLTHFLAFGSGINNLYGKETEIKGSTVTCLSETWSANEKKIHFLENLANGNITSKNNAPFVYTYLTTFSDAFDPTVSLVKANRHGVWVYQVCFLKSVQSEEFENTYVISMGEKRYGHDSIVEKIEQEINALRYGKCPLLYHGGLKKMVQPIVLPLLRHADQPERRELFGLKLGKGSNHSCWRYTMDPKTSALFLPSCDKCKALIEKACLGISSPLLETSCDKCANWEFGHNKMQWKPPHPFPEEMLNSNGLLCPLELLKSVLILAAKLTHHKVSKGKWNSSTAQSFLSYYCVCTKLSDRIIDHALNVRLRTELSCINHPSLDALKKDEEDHPEKYQLAPLPPLWFGEDEIHSFPDSPMHLLSGIVKAVLKLSFKAMKMTGQLNEFFKLIKASDQLVLIEKLNLPWFRITPMKNENFPGMGCENHLAVGRYMKILCEHVLHMKEDTPIIFPPMNTQHTWNKKLNVEWLNIRRLNKEGTAQELRDRVKTYMNSSSCPEEPIITNKVEKSELIRMYASTSNLLSHLLAIHVNNNHINQSYLIIKRFLNDVESVDRKLRQENEVPIWNQKYNLICLLNCREDMLRYGPCRIRWEGDDSGGKNIQQIKPSFTGFHSNWQVHTHRRYMIKKTVAKLKKKIAEDVFENLSKNSVLHVYRCAETALSAYHLGKPLMIVRLKNNCFGVLHSHNKFWQFDEFKFVGIFTYLWRFSLKFNIDDDQKISNTVSADMIQDVCISIPNLDKSYYAIIDMEWRELNDKFEFTYGYL